MRNRVPLALAFALAACARPSTPAAGPPSFEFDVTPPPSGSWTVRVEARLRNAPGPSLVDPGAASALSNVVILGTSGARQLPRSGDAWLAPMCQDACTLRYNLDLAALADGCRGRECARRIGDAVIGAASMFMLRPAGEVDADVHVHVKGGDAARFATGLRPDGLGGYVLRARELVEASYTAFGELRVNRIDVPGASLDVVLLGQPLKMGDAAVLAWMKDAASCVARLYGTFPSQATLFVLPVKGRDEVVFGRVMSLAGGSVVLLFGAETSAASAHADWVVVHELSHLGMASLVGEAHWLEEGLATYYEPILRERAGWMSEEELWAHFAHQMPRGQRKPGDPASLEAREDIDSTYWGGALFCLLADLRIRATSRGTKSLDDVMRAVHERLGDATHGTGLADFIRVGDEATGTDALAQVHAHFAVAGEPVDLAVTWQALGVVPGANGDVTLRDDAPLAWVRRAIGAGEGH
jgi:predicted metalloprotease with PDZ domain